MHILPLSILFTASELFLFVRPAAVQVDKLAHDLTSSPREVTHDI